MTGVSPEPPPGDPPEKAPTAEPVRRLVDWLFRDRSTGRLVVAQWPNLPLWLFLAGAVMSVILPLSGPPALVLRVATDAALLWWALWELLQGVNPFRRILGAVVTVWVVLGLVRQLLG